MVEQAQSKLILIPAGASSLESEDRMVGNADLPLSQEGIEQARRWAEQLRTIGPDIVYSSPSGTAQETARMIAGALRIRHRTERDLAEINLGLWQGMAQAEIKLRHPKVFRQWIELPESVTPPEGECLAEVQQRIDHCIGRIITKHHGACVGVVLGHIALALARLSREARAINDIWTLQDEPLTWHEYLIQEIDTIQENEIE